MTSLSPREIVSAGDRFAIGKEDTKCAAARALVDQPMDAETIVRKAMAIAGDICVYTNGNLVVERIDAG